jgi:GNAT superfamily N-acetyltransferase
VLTLADGKRGGPEAGSSGRTSVMSSPSHAGHLVVRRARPDAWEAWRDLRLRALRIDPDAFGAAWDRERDFTEADWRARLDAGYAVLGLLDGEPVGLGGLYSPQRGVSCVVAMWVVPEHRGRGVGRRILDAVLEKAPTDDRVVLWVADGNPARRLYESAGFVATGGCEPIRPGAALLKRELELAR